MLVKIGDSRFVKLCVFATLWHLDFVSESLPCTYKFQYTIIDKFLIPLTTECNTDYLITDNRLLFNNVGPNRAIDMIHNILGDTSLEKMT